MSTVSHVVDKCIQQAFYTRFKNFQRLILHLPVLRFVLQQEHEQRVSVDPSGAAEYNYLKTGCDHKIHFVWMVNLILNDTYHALSFFCDVYCRFLEVEKTKVHTNRSSSLPQKTLPLKRLISQFLLLDITCPHFTHLHQLCLYSWYEWS